MKRWGTAVLIVLLSASFSLSAGPEPARPSARDRCAVCGMFVAKYANFLAQIRFKDGSTAFFDGCKDMFKYYLNLKRYNPAKTAEDIAAVFVTDYYSQRPVDGREAFYVRGSKVFGPMGKELIPLEKESQAREFMADHVGKGLLRFREVSPHVLKGLE